MLRRAASMAFVTATGLGLALAHADTAIPVADDGQSGEAHGRTALHHLGDAVPPLNHLFLQTVVSTFVRRCGVETLPCQISSMCRAHNSELQAASRAPRPAPSRGRGTQTQKSVRMRRSRCRRPSPFRRSADPRSLPQRLPLAGSTELRANRLLRRRCARHLGAIVRDEGWRRYAGWTGTPSGAHVLQRDARACLLLIDAGARLAVRRRRAGSLLLLGLFSDLSSA